MRILFAVPSKNRATILAKYTYTWLQHIEYDWAIFIEPQDIEQYAEFNNLIILPKNNQGLGFSKKTIKGYAKEKGYDLVFKIDDDIKCFTEFRTRTTPTQTASLLNSFIQKEVILNFEKHANLGAIAFPYSFHMFEIERWKPAKKLQTSYIVRTEFLTNDTLDFSVFEDFAVGLDILVQGSKIMKYGMIGIELGVEVGKGMGGLQDFSRKEMARIEALQLKKMYPPIKFKIVNKPWEIEPDMRSIKL